MTTENEKLDFGHFMAALRGNRIDLAGQVLSALFNVDETRGLMYATHYVNQLRQSPGFMMRSMGLREFITNREVNNALLLIGESFGTDAIHSVLIYQALVARQAPQT